jgi:hypothetical protein
MVAKGTHPPANICKPLPTTQREEILKRNMPKTVYSYMHYNLQL